MSNITEGVAGPLPSLYENCEPWHDVLSGNVDQFSTSVEMGLAFGSEPERYVNPESFFRRTYPTEGLRTLLRTVCWRLSARDGAYPVIGIRAKYGGGKTHGLIALAHVVRDSARTRTSIAPFVDIDLLPTGNIRIAVLDGERSDPRDGIPFFDGTIRVYSPWGEMAAQFGEKCAFESMRAADNKWCAPDAKELSDLLGNEPALVLIDGLNVLWRKAARSHPGSQRQILIFLESLFTAVRSKPRVAVVYTLPFDNDDLVRDVYNVENRELAAALARIQPPKPPGI